MQKITPFLWFNDQAEEAMNFYVSLFKNSRIVSVNRSEGADSGQEGKVFSVIFQLEGQEFFALNGGPHYTFSPAISLFVHCEDQQEVDELWEKLSEGGQQNQCGWITDRYGVTWQIIPSILSEMLYDKDRAKAGRVMEAMLKMHKIEIARLQQAYDASE